MNDILYQKGLIVSRGSKLFKTRLKIVQCAEVGKTPRFLSNISPTQVIEEGSYSRSRFYLRSLSISSTWLVKNYFSCWLVFKHPLRHMLLKTSKFNWLDLSLHRHYTSLFNLVSLSWKNILADMLVIYRLQAVEAHEVNTFRQTYTQNSTRNESISRCLALKSTLT